MFPGSKNHAIAIVLFLTVSISHCQILNFQMVANEKTNACLSEWFGEDETLAISFNMDEHLTNELQNNEKGRAGEDKIIAHLAKNISIKIFDETEELKTFKNTLSGSFTHVTEDYQTIRVCVHNSVNHPVIIGKQGRADWKTSKSRPAR